MPATARTVQQMSRAGLAPSYSAPDAVNGESIANNGQTFLHVKNTGGAACTVSFDLPNQVDGQTPPDKTVSVPATTGDRMIGPFPIGQYNDSNGNLGVTYSTATGVTVAAINLPH